MQSQYATLLQKFEEHLQSWQQSLPHKPESLYKPQQYILGIGGKRIRPLMVLVACDLFSAHIEKAIPSAIGIELFHNFSLMHDDIMDKAPLRRGKETVHTRWNENIALLSGDAMLVKAYEAICNSDKDLIQSLLKIFNRTALEVCEGQQYDMDFEKQSQVTKESYLEMIRCKTAVLLGCALEMGALCGGANEKAQKELYAFGVEIGIVFQLMDDLLDAYGNEKVGKQIGGDILANKKTILFVEAINRADADQKKKLLELYQDNELDSSQKINSVLAIFNDLNIKAIVEKNCHDLTRDAEKHLKNCGADFKKINALFDFFMTLLQREN